MTEKRDKNTIPPEMLAAYEELVARLPGVERKGANVPYASLNGHMFSYLAADGTLALRLPEEVRVRFLEKYKTRLMEAYGVVQKEYVVVPGELLKKTDELKPYFEMSPAYVQAMKPKATKNGKSAE